MFKTLIKLLAVYFVNKRLSNAKDNFVGVKNSLAEYTESRAALVKNDFSRDIHCMLITLLGYLSALLVFVLANVVGLAWIFAVSWDSPNRMLILTGMIFALLTLSGILFILSRRAWGGHSFMHNSSLFLNRDWLLFKDNLEVNPEQQ